MSYESLQKAQEQLQEEKRKVALQFKELLTNYLVDVTTKTPYTKLRWVQYTPYWNDGSPCVFGVELPELYTEGPVHKTLMKVFEDSEDPEDNFWYYYPYSDVTRKSLPPELQRLEKLFTELEPWYFQETFGDHVTVTFEANAYYVTDYSHD